MYSECTVADEMLYATLTEEQKRAARCVLRDEIEDDEIRYDRNAERIDVVRDWLNTDAVLDAEKFVNWMQAEGLDDQYPDIGIIRRRLGFTPEEIEEKLA